jgi:hypothetical protein
VIRSQSEGWRVCVRSEVIRSQSEGWRVCVSWLVVLMPDCKMALPSVPCSGIGSGCVDVSVSVEVGDDQSST